MADKENQQPSREDVYRTHAERWEDSTEFPHVAALWAIAAELAEGNSRDREAEIRARAAESFVAGIQEQLAKQHIVIPGGMKVPK